MRQRSRRRSDAKCSGEHVCRPVRRFACLADATGLAMRAYLLRRGHGRGRALLSAIIRAMTHTAELSTAIAEVYLSDALSTLVHRRAES